MGVARKEKGEDRDAGDCGRFYGRGRWEARSTTGSLQQHEPATRNIYIYTYTHVRKCMYARAWGRNYARASIRTLLSASARNLSDDIQLVRLARSLPLFRGDLYALGNRETEVGCIIQIF